MTDQATINTELRAWARGMYGLEAAVELLIRTDLAMGGLEWIGERNERGHRWVNFEAAAREAESGALSSGERYTLLFACSLAGELPIRLDDVAHLDRGRVQVVLAAISHASGAHEHLTYIDHRMGVIGRRTPEEATLYPWPEVTA